MRYGKIASALVTVAGLLGAMTASVAASSAAAQTSAPAMQMASNQADAEFVSMMIPHHYQALIMSRMAPGRSNDATLLALASRIEVEQDLEIDAMQRWQLWNGLEVTDAEQAYEDLLQDPMMLEHMGMATPEELDDLSASTGTAFDVLYLGLMIDHHQGALDMLLDVLINGSDPILQQMATDMYVTQYTQILQMENMLANKT